ncbi:MAG TPA: hypothetical protein PKG52_09850, partial [bacterium]|nr:hypothetical protein [bacterium]
MKKIILLILLVLFIFSPLFGEDHVPYYLDQIENKFVEPTLTTIDKRRETYYVLINSSDNADVLLMAKNYYELIGKMND